MLISQIAVFLENRQGRLNDLLGAIKNANVNIDSLNIADTSDFGIVRMITDDNEKALKVLKDAGFTALLNDLVAIEVDDKPGSLSKTVDEIDKAGINIEYVYSYTVRKGTTLILLRVDNIMLAQEILEKNNMNR